MKRRYLAFVLAAALPLSGCASILERSYESVKPHTSQYWEDVTASALRAEDYQGLVNGLMLLVSEQADTALVRLYGYADQNSAIDDMDRACAEVSMEDPLGAYLVDYVTYDCTESTNCYEMTVRFTYQKTPVQLQTLINATTAGALPELLRSALEEGRGELAVKVDYMDRSAEEIEADVAALMEAYGLAEEVWEIGYYPDAGNIGDTRIVEIMWQLPEEPFTIEFPDILE